MRCWVKSRNERNPYGQLLRKRTLARLPLTKRRKVGINISGVLETDEPILNCVTSGTDKDADIAVLQAFSLINRATTGAGTLTVQCFGDVPTVAIPITLLVVR